jgi:pyrophosphatase PpaX
MLNQTKAFLFDLDGTLLDTFDFIYGAFENTYSKHGIEPLSHDQIRHLMGGPLESVYHAMAPEYDAALLAETHRAFQAAHTHLVKLFPDTLQVLDELKRRDMKIAAITTRSNRSSIRSLEVTGIAKYFDMVISAEDVQNHKPNPEPLFKALKFLRVEPQDAVMTGDTGADIMAGKNAGTKTVAALYGFGGETLIELNPDYLIQNLGSLLRL